MQQKQITAVRHRFCFHAKCVCCPCPQEYFRAAAKYLDGAVEGPSVTDILGVWLSSDDESVLAEVGGKWSKRWRAS